MLASYDLDAYVAPWRIVVDMKSQIHNYVCDLWPSSRHASQQAELD